MKCFYYVIIINLMPILNGKLNMKKLIITIIFIDVNQNNIRIKLLYTKCISEKNPLVIDNVINRYKDNLYNLKCNIKKVFKL